MTKCTIIGKIRIPASVGQAIRINGKKCNEETVWTIADVYGGDSSCTDFSIENRSGVTFPVEFVITPADDGEYTAGVFLDDGVTPVASPITMNGQETKNLKFIIAFDKYIATDEYELVIEFDFV